MSNTKSVFNAALSLYLSKNEEPAKQEIVDIMKKASLFNIQSKSTFYRKALTINSWNCREVPDRIDFLTKSG